GRSMTPRRACLHLETLEARLAPSITPVPDSTAYPFSAVVRIEAHFPNQRSNQFTESSGVLIDRFHVLTAAHVIYSHADGGWADEVVVFPGQNGQRVRPFGQAFGTLERAFNPFIDSDNRGSYDDHGDLALITLDRPIGDSAGWLALGFN